MRRAGWIVALLGVSGLALADDGRFEPRGDGGWHGGGRLVHVDRRGDDRRRHGDHRWRDERGWRDRNHWDDHRGYRHRDGHWDRGWHRGWEGPRFRPAPRYYYPERYRYHGRPSSRDRYYRGHHHHGATLDLILSVPL